MKLPALIQALESRKRWYETEAPDVRPELRTIQLRVRFAGRRSDGFDAELDEDGPCLVECWLEPMILDAKRKWHTSDRSTDGYENSGSDS